MKKIIFCADDYGQNQAISQAIIYLIEKKRLSAASCMTNSVYWPIHSQWLLPFKDQVDLGLHFNLTEGKPLSANFGNQFPSLAKLMLNVFLKRIDISSIEEELHLQLDQFEKQLGHIPDFIDGHQHIHHLPLVRDAVLDLYKNRLKLPSTYVRSVYTPLKQWVFKRNAIKTAIIQHSGASSFKRRLIKLGIPHNQTFAGFNGFNLSVPMRSLYLSFFSQIQDGGLIMCHPGCEEAISNDPIALYRVKEYHYLSSEQFREDYMNQRINFVRFIAKA